ncbi:endospore germination permease [Metabacillus litoralis]|jgi:spore germination protein KB|uniref:GerAB/ArcD/ProY family transporter n=1 Tax=Metabacillus litoralis TaxID=152268 RepID=UPI00203C61D7|nr:endospore germination permease [Metabacillus litoralis]
MGGILVKYEKDQVGFREFFAIIVITISTKSTDMSTVLLLGDGLNAAWMIVIGSFLLILPSIIILNSVLKKYQSKNILEITQLALGKPLAFIISFIMLFFTLTNTASDSRSYLTQLITINFPNTPLFIIYLCFLTICIWGAKKGWESIASVTWMSFPYLMIVLGILFFLMLKEASFARTFPLFGTGKWEIAKASFNYTSLFGDAIILAMMYPFVKDHKTYTRSLFSALFFTVFIMVLMYLLYVWMFDYRSVEKITFPFNEAIRFVSLGRAITNVETFFITLWLIAVFIKFTVYIYLVCKIFGFVFHIKEFEHTIIPITFLILMIAMIPENNEVIVFAIREYTVIYFKYLLLFLPPLLWAVIKMREVRAR